MVRDSVGVNWNLPLGCSMTEPGGGDELFFDVRWSLLAAGGEEGQRRNGEGTEFFEPKDMNSVGETKKEASGGLPGRVG